MSRTKWWTVGVLMLGSGLAAGWFLNSRTPALAGGSNDRFEDFILATGPVNQGLSNNNAFVQAELDGLWLLDYRSGKLLASTLNRQTGKMIGWGELDLVKEFELTPRTSVHFMMTTGNVIKGQSVLYLVETTTGKIGVYSMTASESPTAGNANGSITIRRHDITTFRAAAGAQANQPGVLPGQAVQPAGFQGLPGNPVQPPNR
jgi:hypothetical protein